MRRQSFARAEAAHRQPSAPPPLAILRPKRADRLVALRRRLGLLLVLYAIALQFTAAVEVTSWHWRPHPEVRWTLSIAVLALMVLRGLPLGYFLGFGLRRRGAFGASALAGLGLGAGLALCDVVGERPIEPLGVAVLVVSAAAGAVGFLVLARRLRARATNDAALLAPDLPLVGGAYVSAPLLWLASASAARFDGMGERWGLVALSLYGASLIGSSRASRGPASGGPLAHGAAAAVWCAVGLAPLVSVAPMQVVALAAAAGAFATLHPLLLGMRGRDRRVEGPALRRALPLFVLYLVLAGVAPLAAMRAGRPGTWPTWAVVAASVPAGSWAELAAAMAVLGYAVTELRGRRDERSAIPWRAAAPWLAAVAAVVAVLRAVAAVPATPIGIGVRVIGGWMLCMIAARAGAGLYELQRRHARAHAIEGAGVRATPKASERGARRWAPRRANVADVRASVGNVGA